MQITILSENLQKKLSFVTHAISTRSQLPILSHVLLEASGGKLFLRATDLEIGIEVYIQAEVQEEGIATLPAKLFQELVLSLPAEKIELLVKDNQLSIQGTKTHAVLQITQGEEFPQLYEEKGEETLLVKGSVFQEAFEKVVFAASMEATRPALSGVLLQPKQTGIHLVATDGYRLSLDTLSQEEGKEGRSVIVPAKVIREAMNFSDNEDIRMYISEKNNQVLFEQKDMIVVGRLIEAEFPKYEKILPTDHASQLFVDKEALQKAVKTTAIFARETANVIKFALSKNKIVVSAKTPSLGENTVEVDARLIGEENEIAFNVKYIQDMLSHLSEKDILFEMTGPLNPGVFKVEGKPHFLHLIMPIKV